MNFVLSPPEGSLTTLVHWECVLNEANLCLGLGYDLSGTSGMTFGEGVWVLRAKMGRDFLSFCSFSFFKLFLRGLLLCFTKHMYFFSPKNVYLLCYQACDSSTLLKRWNLFHEICKSASRKWLLPSMAQYLVLQGSTRWKLSVANLPSSWAERASRQCVQADGFLKLFCEMTRCHRCCKIES